MGLEPGTPTTAPQPAMTGAGDEAGLRLRRTGDSPAGTSSLRASQGGTAATNSLLSELSASPNSLGRALSPVRRMSRSSMPLLTADCDP
ncbi:MAG: hypothetical protein CMP23_02200 [Rickettsiales bacterium]|nr:hypothetical protein [Rickettsiales bacterium]